ncbi:MAG: HU family DNA-binding protein [Prevotella sp.]|nr:HU family DNA-binding protein [Prevotella sp.]
MAKNKIMNITSALSTKYKMPLKEAEAFVAMVFDVVNEGLQKDKLVKVKGLGTFKVAAVKDRESVNVNTGERVLIEGHDKITFTPDAVLRDFVNKPFAQFETVVVKDGVDFSDLDSQKVPETIETPETSETAETPDTPDTLLSAVPEEPKESEAPEAPETPETPETVETSETPAVLGEASQDVRTEQQVIGEKPSGHKNLILACLLAVVAFIAGFFIGRGTAGQADKPAAPETTVEAPADSVETTATTAAKQDDTASFEAYNSDPRIKYGAYDIVGIDTVITLRPGQTLQSVCRATLGADMMSYMEVMNDAKSLETGKVKVPKLKMRNFKK